MFSVFGHHRYELAGNKDLTSKSIFTRQLLRTIASVKTEIGQCQINTHSMMGNKSQSVTVYFNHTYSHSHSHTHNPHPHTLNSLHTTVSLQYQAAAVGALGLSQHYVTLHCCVPHTPACVLVHTCNERGRG